MTSEFALIENMKQIVNKRGANALDLARIEILSEFTSNDNVSDALKHLAKITFRNALPVFPALISIACESAGAKCEKTEAIGKAMTLIAGAADLHDDVIDESPVKNGKRTVFGKYGKEITILAGDTLLAWGLNQLQKGCKSLAEEQGSRILDLATQAILKISHAEALEAQLRKTKHISTKSCMNIIDFKAIVPETHMRIGAIIGCGNSKLIDVLGNYGRVFGLVSTIAEEFMDVIEKAELENRLRNNYPPMPFVYAGLKPELVARSQSNGDEILSEKEFKNIKEAVLKSAGANKLKGEMRTVTENEIDNLRSMSLNKKTRDELEIILSASLQLLERIDA